MPLGSRYRMKLLVYIFFIMIAAWIFVFINGVGVKLKKGLVIITSKDTRETTAWVVFHFNGIGLGQPIVPVRGSPFYIIYSELEGREVQSAVSRDTYERLSQGEQVQVSYKQARITKAIFIEQFHK
jgi:hypothetical protein